MAAAKYARAASTSVSYRSSGSSRMSRNISARWRARTPASAAVARRIWYSVSAVSRGTPARAATEPRRRRTSARQRPGAGRAAAGRSARARRALPGRDRAVGGCGAPGCSAAPRRAGGRVEVAGFIPWTGGPAFKRRIALVLGNRQQLVWDLPPEETFLLNRAIYDVGDGDYRERLAELVALLELGDVLQKPVRQLSLGERMKCELVASLLHRPPLLFLDEPTLGLDVTAQDAIRRFLIEYRDRHGATVLLTSHYMQDVTALASRVLMINRGRLLYDGALEALVARIARTKRIELVLGGGDGNRVTAEALAAFGEV